MKKFALCLLAIAGIVSSAGALAGSSAPTGYYTSLHPSTAAAVKAAKVMFPPTDITIINASDTAIWASILGTNPPVNDLIYPGINDHIRHSTFAGDTYVDLKDPNGVAFYYAYVSGPFCRLAVVTVTGKLNPATGRVDKYNTNVDRELCN